MSKLTLGGARRTGPVADIESPTSVSVIGGKILSLLATARTVATHSSNDESFMTIPDTPAFTSSRISSPSGLRSIAMIQPLGGGASGRDR